MDPKMGIADLSCIRLRKPIDALSGLFQIKLRLNGRPKIDSSVQIAKNAYGVPHEEMFLVKEADVVGGMARGIDELETFQSALVGRQDIFLGDRVDFSVFQGNLPQRLLAGFPDLFRIDQVLDA